MLPLRFTGGSSGIGVGRHGTHRGSRKGASMDVLLLIGRFCFGIMFVRSGIFGHFRSYRPTTGYAAAKKIPMPGAAVLLSGFMIILGGLGIILGAWADLSAILLAVFLFATTFFIHNFWTIPKSEGMTRMQDRIHFEKDLSLLGASLIVFAVVAYGGEFGPSLTDPLFDL
jgi:putative oxidoreductase